MTEKEIEKNYYSELLTRYKGDAKRTWNVIRDVIGKKGSYRDTFPKDILSEGVKIIDEKTIAETFNKFFINVGPKIGRQNLKIGKDIY